MLDGAKRHGASEEALVEALTVAVEMGGGPALMYAGKAACTRFESCDWMARSSHVRAMLVARAECGAPLPTSP